MADRKISDLTALTTPATGDLIPIVDISEAAAADKNKSITVGELLRGAPDGTAAAPGIAFESDGGNGMFLGGTDILAFSTGGTQAVTIDASQRVGLGDSAPANKLQILEALAAIPSLGSGGHAVAVAGSTNYGLALGGLTTGDGYLQAGRWSGTATAYNLLLQPKGGSVGIGTTSPGSLGELLHVVGKARFQEAAGSGAIALIGANSTEAYFDTSTYGTVQPIAFKLNGDEKARIDSSGRLLVGTTTSTGSNELLQSYSTNGNNLGIGRFTSASSTFGSEFNLHRSRGALGTNTSILTGDTIGTINFKGADGTSYLTAASIAAFADAGVSTNDMPGRLVFSTTADSASSPTERMRISSDGSISTAGILTAPSATVFGTVLGRTGAAGLFETSRNVGAAVNTAIIRGTAGALNVHGDGDCENTNNSYTGISDIKLKENIVDANSQWDDLKAFQVRNYNFKAETGFNTHTQIGLIAQEVELVSPGLVGESIDEETGESTKSVNYSVLYMKAVKALQEAMERIETLEQRLTDAGIA